ncbi:MAG: AMP-binding protein, partial [Acidobacteriota bacterium]
DRTILQCQRLPDHFAAFWACVLGGIVPVTVAISPSFDAPNAVLAKVWNIWKLLEGPWILTNADLEEPLGRLPSLFGGDTPFPYRTLSIERLAAHTPTHGAHPTKPTDVAFYQLTSGSTGVPKCIQETHRGIIHHIHGSAQFNSYSADDVTFNWLPMDHVVPMLTFHLKDTYLGIRQIHAPPSFVLASPLAWLDQMHRHRVSHTWSPNFGFKLVADALADDDPGGAGADAPKRWDLSALTFAMNAGEQVTLPVVRGFLEKLEPYGVTPQVMQPAFGMAEVCTCMTYCNDFTVESGAHHFSRASLGGALEKADPGNGDVQTFVDLGHDLVIRVGDPDLDA